MALVLKTSIHFKCIGGSNPPPSGSFIMKKLILLTSLILLLLIPLSGCGNEGAKTVSVSEIDNGKTVQLQLGQKIKVVLEDNPTTGYNWQTDSKDMSAIEQVGPPQFQPSSKLIGAGGKITVLFLAKAKGKDRLKLVYRRSWEKKPPIKEFQIKVIVK